MAAAFMRASLNPLNVDDLQTLQDIIAKSQQLDELIQKAKAIGLPVEDSEARNNMMIDVAKKIVKSFFPNDYTIAPGVDPLAQNAADPNEIPQVEPYARSTR